jgi:hypothetical protein
MKTISPEGALNDEFGRHGRRRGGDDSINSRRCGRASCCRGGVHVVATAANSRQCRGGQRLARCARRAETSTKREKQKDFFLFCDFFFRLFFFFFFSKGWRRRSRWRARARATARRRRRRERRRRIVGKRSGKCGNCKRRRRRRGRGGRRQARRLVAQRAHHAILGIAQKRAWTSATRASFPFFW